MKKMRLSKGLLARYMFVNKELAFKGWLDTSEETALPLASYIESIGYHDEAIIEGAETNPKFRQKSLYTYAYAMTYVYCEQMGKSRMVVSVDRSRLAVHKAQKKLGAKVTYSGVFISLLYLWNFYRLHPVIDK